VFIGEFLRSVAVLVRQGLSSDYRGQEGNRPTLRGRLLIAPHVRENFVRPDRFYTAHDEFSRDRPENRLIRSSLRVALATTVYQEHQQLGRELEFAFAEVPPSADPARDFAHVRIDRSMGQYRTTLDWCALVLAGLSPLTGRGKHAATSLLFPMESLFEGFVAQHLPRQLVPGMHLRRQVKSLHLVRHRQTDWFQLRPDLAIEDHGRTLLLLDTKWKLLDQDKASAKDKYQLSQGDFYQLFAYGRTYLEGRGNLVLIYPKTDCFEAPLHVFEFPRDRDLRLWVLPFCLKTKELLLPEGAALDGFSQHLRTFG
jgi:5-methylcytosine-specific restriction enzyme subunit McrC